MTSAGARIAVTGAAGFIGSALCRRLVADGHEVVGIDLAGGAAGPGVTARDADVTDPRGMRAALQGCTHVVHTAARVSDWGPLEDFVRVNVHGTRTVLEAARDLGLERAVHVSTVAVWGYEFATPRSEDDPPQPAGVPYVDTKGVAELVARRLGATVVRPGDVYGPGSTPWVIRPLRALRRGVFALPGDGGGVMTLVYVDDLVDCLVRALFEAAAQGRSYTAWDGEPVSAREYFGALAAMLGQDGVRCLPRRAAMAGALGLEAGARLTGREPLVTRTSAVFVTRRAAYPNLRAREELGWTPRIDRAEGLRRTEAWAREAGLLGGA